jgi:hypothetical protein
MLRFKSYLVEDFDVQILILEGKAQHQVVKQFGPKILELMQRDQGRLGEAGDLPGTLHYEKIKDQEGHGTPEHMSNYILKHMGIPEAPSYLNISKPEDANTWNQHVNWMLTRYAQGGQGVGKGGIQRLEDIQYRALPALAKFHKLTKEGKLNASSLAKWKHLTDMEDALQNADPLNAEGVDPDEYTVHGENEHWTVVTPHTAEAACSLGHGTNWCTTSGAFEQYNEQGPLHIAIPKKPSHKNEKYQLHIESNQFMDEGDEPVSKEQFLNTHKSRPFPTSISAPAKTKFNLSAEHFNEEEMDHILKTNTTAALRIGLGEHISKPRVMEYLKTSRPRDIDNVARVLSQTKHIQKEDVDYIFNNFKGHHSGTGEFGPHVINAFLGKNFVDMLPGHKGKTNYDEHITPEHLKNAYEYSISKDADFETAKKLKEKITSHPNVPEDVLEHARSIRNHSAYANPRTTAKQIEQFFEEEKANPNKETHNARNTMVLQNAVRNPNFPQHMFESIINYDQLPKRQSTYSVRFDNRNEYDFHGINVFDAEMKQLRNSVLQNPSLSDKHIHKVLDTPSLFKTENEHADALRSIIFNPSATPKHIVKAIETAPVDINSSSIKKNKHSFTHTVLDKYNAQSKGVVPEEVFDALVRNETGMYGTLGSLIKHSQFTDKHADELMKKFEGNQFVQDEIIKQMNSKKQQPITPSQY